MSEENQVNTQSAESGDKTIAIIAYFSFVGLIIAFVMNNEKKDSFAKYHIRQSLGIVATSLVLMVINVIPILGWIISLFGWIFVVFLAIKGIINAMNYKEVPVPVLGKKYEEWFKTV